MAEQWGAAQWFVGRDGTQTGPMSEQELKSSIAAGTVGPDDYVWCADFTDWKRIGDVFAPPLRPPPLPPNPRAAQPPQPGSRDPGASPTAPDPHGKAPEMIDCALCGAPVQMGRPVCGKCGASIFYNRMPNTYRVTVLVAALLGGVPALLALFALPFVIASGMNSERAGVITFLVVLALILLAIKGIRRRWRNKIVFTKGLMERSIPLRRPSAG